MAEKIDRRARRSRKLIQEALFALMKEMPYRKIRISHISERADISRSTFYLHYETKDQLLLSVADEIIDEYFQAIYQNQPGSQVKPAHLLFSKWKQNLDKMRLLIDTGMEFHIYQRFRSFNAQWTRGMKEGNPRLNDYIRTMLDGASFALLVRWTRDNADVPAEQMEKLFNSLKIEALFNTLEKEMPDFGQGGY